MKRRNLEKTGKISARLLAEYYKENHQERCIPDQPIVMGLLEDIDVEDKGDHSIWVEDGQVYLFLKCPIGVHQSVKEAFSSEISRSIENNKLDNFVYPTGSVTMYVENQLAGQEKFKKEADYSLSLWKGFSATQVYPVFMVEVAVYHESLHQLLCEGAAWLNSRTDVLGCLLVSVDISSGMINIFHLGRVTPPSSDPIKRPDFMDIEDCLEKTTKQQAETLAAKSKKNKSPAFGQRCSLEKLEARYQVKLLQDLHILINEPFTTGLVLDLKYLADITGLNSSELTLNLSLERVIRAVKEQIRIHMDETEQTIRSEN